MEAQPPTPIKVSVVIPTYNRRESLARTLTTVFAQDFPPKEYEVVITVDGSTDGTAEFLRQLKPGPALRVIEHPRNLGQSAARNSAIRLAQGEIILFVYDDILCDRSLLKEHVTAHESADALVVSGPTLVAPENPPGLLPTAWRWWSATSRCRPLGKFRGPKVAGPAIFPCRAQCCLRAVGSMSVFFACPKMLTWS